MEIKNKIIYTLYFILYTLFCLYSYAFLDIGLTLTSFDPYLNFQKRMQWFGYFNRSKSSVIFVLLSILLFTVYCLLFTAVKRSKLSIKKILFLSVLICGILILAYPSFSHDIFNYIFNAKMVLIYKVNPHQQVAADFPDAMLGFMRNIHTPAPYFYGWTIISLFPFLLGFNRIFPEILSFKLFAVLFFLLTFIILKKIFKQLKFKDSVKRLTLFLLNPFIIIEAVAAGHNDLVMMALALASFYFLIRFKKEKKIKFLLCSMFYVLCSISIKYATIVLIPLFLIWYFKPKFNIGFFGAILLFLLPFTRPLDQLHSWYLIWPLIWVFLSKKIKAVYFFVFLSFFALLRYAPYIYYGNWNPPVPFLRLMIYFVLPLFLLFTWIGKAFWVKWIHELKSAKKS